MHTGGQQQHAKMLNITNHQGNKIKTTTYNLIFFRVIIIKKKRKTISKNTGKKKKGEPSNTVGGDINWCSQ